MGMARNFGRTNLRRSTLSRYYHPGLRLYTILKNGGNLLMERMELKMERLCKIGNGPTHRATVAPASLRSLPLSRGEFLPLSLLRGATNEVSGVCQKPYK
jgi:hypothetical protein